LSNDESTDNSFKIANDFAKKHDNFKVLDLPHGGKPSAIWGGIQVAKYDWVLFTDMDQSTPLKEIENYCLLSINTRLLLAPGVPTVKVILLSENLCLGFFCFFVA